ncbi:hypothetical protein ABTX82_01655 [Streptomyces lavendulae]|uniref:hypothetical protein n=1 Tax=Streptomyces lavendulae TaxID=1914 RepID=UPI00332EF0C3
MDLTKRTRASVPGNQPSPARRLIAAGIKRGPAAWLVEQPAMSQADRAAHVAASHVRRPAVAS